VDASEFVRHVEKAFETAKDRLQGREEKERMRFRGNIASSYVTYFNQDGSIDAELRIEAIPNELSVNKLFTAIERVLGDVPEAHWQTGVRYIPREDEPFYTKFMGMSQAESWYHGERIAALATGKLIDKKMRDMHRRKPKQVFIRAHWSPSGEHPKVRWET
jgi:hypothetical protein